jgi:hypothetical protein
MSELERDWTRVVRDELTARGALVMVAAANRYTVPGWPDRWVCHCLWAGWLELKTEDGLVSALQARRVREICARRPGTAWVLRRRVDHWALQGADGLDRCEVRPCGACLLLALAHMERRETGESRDDAARAAAALADGAAGHAWNYRVVG